MKRFKLFTGANVGEEAGGRSTKMKCLVGGVSSSGDIRLRALTDALEVRMPLCTFVLKKSERKTS